VFIKTYHSFILECPHLEVFSHDQQVLKKCCKSTKSENLLVESFGNAPFLVMTLLLRCWTIITLLLLHHFFPISLPGFHNGFVLVKIFSPGHGLYSVLTYKPF